MDSVLKAGYLDGFDKAYLEMLGFCYLPRAHLSTSVDERIRIHCCCESGRFLSNPVSKHRVKTFDITKADDFTNGDRVKNVTATIRGPGCVFFDSSPCTGETTWQRLQLELAKCNGWEQTIVKLIKHWDLHWRLWKNCEKVIKHFRKAAATVMPEWPRFGEYWQ